jgi:uncharacterized protein YecE (DUF72 family)
MEQRIRVGCCGFGPDRRRYFERFSAIEYQQSFFFPPRVSVLQKMRAQAPEGFAFVIKAWQLITHEPSEPGYQRLPNSLTLDSGSAGHFRSSSTVIDACEKTLAAAEALGAEAILFETPRSFTPTANNRMQMTRFFERIKGRDQLMIWEPRGVWSTEEVIGMCADLDLVPCWDPFVSNALPPTKVAYLKLRGMGATRRYSDGQLGWLANALTPYSKAFCIFNTESMFRDGSRLLPLIHMDFR